MARLYWYALTLTVYLTTQVTPTFCADVCGNGRNGTCQSGYCCVRDSFLADHMYCKRIGREGDHCATKVMESECPCANTASLHLYCRPNLTTPTYTSLFGRCANMTSSP